MKHLIMLLTVIAVFTYSSAAQSISDFDIKHFNTENGLPQNSIKAVAPDEYGFIWLATEAGLLRYDGKNFKIYNKKNTGASTSRILTIARAPEGKDLLAVSEVRKLLLITKGKAKPYQHSFNTAFLQQPENTHYPNDSVLVMAFRKYYYMGGQLLFPGNGYKVVLTLNDGVRWYKKANLIAHTPLKPLKDFSSVFILDKAIFLSQNELSDGVITRLEPDGMQQVKIAGDFMKQAPGNRSEEHFFITNYADRTVFLSSGSNLYLVSLLPDGNLNTRLLLSGFDLHAHLVNSVYYDAARGRLFLGSGTEGLFIFTRKRFFSALHPGKDFFTNVHYSLVSLNDSSLLSGSGIVFSTQKGTPPGQKELLKRPGNFGYELFRSAKRGIWFYHGLYLYQLDDAARKIVRKFKVGVATAVSQHPNNDIWVGTFESGIYKIDSSGNQSKILTTITHTQCIVWETDTQCWIGTEDYLFRFHTRSGRIDTIGALNGKIVRSMYIPKPNEVWICTYENGLYLWKDNKLVSFAINEHPALQTVHKILEDSKGFFWISTNDGLYQASRADLLRHFEDSTFQPYFFRYSSLDGFLTNEFNGSRQHAGTSLANGFFAFPSMKGVVFFKPEATLPELPAEPIIIDRIVVDDKEINTEHDPVTIKRDFKQITITPATAFMGVSANLQYEFRLDKNIGWQALTGGSIVFSALSSGEHRVTIRKRSGFGTKGYVYCNLDIYIPPAWWQRTWFYISSIILLGLLFWMIVWLRTRYWRHRSRRFEDAVQSRTLELNDMILELERSEEKLSEQLHFQRSLNENITHDVNAPLKYLTIYTSEVLEQVRSNRLPNVNEVEHIYNATQNMHALVENLTLFLKNKYKTTSLSNINVWKLVQQKVELFSMGAKKRNIQLRNDTDPDLSIHQNEILLGILLHNLIDNAVKHTTKGSIFITTQSKEASLLLQIKDTGNGMPEEQVHMYNDFFSSDQNKLNIPSGLGFKIVREIARVLQLTVHIKSIMEEGTEVTIIIPLNVPSS